jgi:hypothetical protein
MPRPRTAGILVASHARQKLRSHTGKGRTLRSGRRLGCASSICGQKSSVNNVGGRGLRLILCCMRLGLEPTRQSAQSGASGGTQSITPRTKTSTVWLRLGAGRGSWLLQANIPWKTCASFSNPNRGGARVAVAI